MVSNIQAIVVSKDQYSRRGADNWIKLHGFRPLKTHETIYTYRFRLKTPNDKYDYRMKTLTKGIKAVIYFPKTQFEYF